MHRQIIDMSKKQHLKSQITNFEDYSGYQLTDYDEESHLNKTFRNQHSRNFNAAQHYPSDNLRL